MRKMAGGWVRGFALGALWAGGTLAAWAGQEPLTLEQAVREGREASPRLSRAQAGAEESRWKKHEMLSGFLPKVSMTASHFIAAKYQLTDVQVGPSELSIPMIFPTTSLAVDLSLPLFDGLQNYRKYSASAILNEASERELDWAAFQVEQDVRLRYYQAIAARKLEDVAHQNVTTLEDHLKKIQARKQGGVATNFDVLRVEVQLHEAQSEALSAEDNVVLARRRLAEAMGLENDDRVVQGDLPVPDAARVRNLQAVDLSKRADIESLQKKADAADRTEAGNSVWWVPRVSLGGQYLFYNNRNTEILDTAFYRSAYQLGVFINWNIFDGAISLSRSRQSVAQRQQADKALDAARLHVGTDFEFWKRRYLYSSALYSARAVDVEKGKESVRLAFEGFKAGTRTNTDMLDAELDLFRARAATVSSQANAVEAQLNLELALGRGI